MSLIVSYWLPLRPHVQPDSILENWEDGLADSFDLFGSDDS